MAHDVLATLGFEVKQAQPARLLPTLPESRKEERATSILMAMMKVVPALASEILSRANLRLGVRSKVHVFTEVVFKNSESRSRPDGLIIVEMGSKKWSALIESKVGNNQLESAQLEDYLLVARDNGCDAIITFSNEYTSQPDHHPTRVSRQRVRNVGMYHFSWLSLQSLAFVLLDSMRVSDVEQAYLLEEFLSYMDSDRAGIKSAYRLSPHWKNVSEAVNTQQALAKSSEDVLNAVNDWHQLVRYLSIQMTRKLGEIVSVNIGRKASKDSSIRVSSDLSTLVSDKYLTASLSIPDTAADIEITADFSRRSLTVTSRLDAPKDIKRPTASINWVKRQLSKCKTSEQDILFVKWPRRYKDTSDFVQYLEERVDALVPEGCKDIPVEFAIKRHLDAGAKFKAASTMVELTESLLVEFYGDIVQNIVAWVPKAPRLKQVCSDENSDADYDDEAGGDV